MDLLRENDGKFSYEEFLDNQEAYEETTISLRESKDYSLYYKVLACYWEHYKELVSEPIYSYQPGMDYAVSLVLLFEYAKTMEKGIPGVVEADHDEMTRGYLAVLKRIHECRDWRGNYINGASKEMVDSVMKRARILLENAYCDDIDCYSQALYFAGKYFEEKGEFKKALRFYKKGAEFDPEGRMIQFPFYLVAKNQAKVGDFYEFGKGVEVNLSKAKKNYNLAAQNLGYEMCPLLGRIYLQEGKYPKAFYALMNCFGRSCRYDDSFIIPEDYYEEVEDIAVILDGKEYKTEEENFVFALLNILEFAHGGDKEKDWKAAIPAKYQAKAEEILERFR